MKALLLLLVLAGDERKHVEAVCPVDGFKFQALEVVGTNQWGGLDWDFCPHAFKTTPLEFFVWACPSCGFAGKKKDFEAALTDDEKISLRARLAPPIPLRKGMKQSDIPGHVKYDLLAQVHAIRKSKPEEAARAWLHASWSLRQQGAVYLDGFDEWEALRDRYGLNQPPLRMGKRNRTEFELEAAAKIEKERHFGANQVLAPYLVAYLYRKHGENGDAERALAELEKRKGQNSVVDDASAKMRASIPLEREYQKKALAAYQAALEGGGLEKTATSEVQYIIGELSRRGGDLKAAAAAYVKTLELSSSEAIRKLATDRLAALPK